jgi:hypothetical protein
MKLTWEETKDIANNLDDIIGKNFHDAIYNVLWQREGNDEQFGEEVSDEDIIAIKEQLKRIL